MSSGPEFRRSTCCLYGDVLTRFFGPTPNMRPLGQVFHNFFLAPLSIFAAQVTELVRDGVNWEERLGDS